MGVLEGGAFGFGQERLGGEQVAEGVRCVGHEVNRVGGGHGVLLSGRAVGGPPQGL